MIATSSVSSAPPRPGPAELLEAADERHVPCRVGVSPPLDHLEQAATARRLAEVALETVPAGQTGVACLSTRLAGAMVVSAPAMAAHVADTVLGRVFATSPKERAVLLETLQALLAQDCSPKQAAHVLGCHRNTVFKRMARIEELTGRRLDNPRDVTDLTLAVEAARLVLGKI
jgi:DNA-binding PucR family transcriptional regulator